MLESHRRWIRCLALGALLSGAPRPEALGAEPVTSPVAEDPATRFKELGARAEAAYQSRQYQSAVDLYLEAYGVLPSADVLYNIAYLYDRHLGNLELAQDFYRRVIREPNSTKDIMELSMRRLAEIDAKLTARATVLDGSGVGVPPAVATSTPTNGTVARQLERDDDGPGAAPWVFIGIGTAAILGGAVMAFAASSTHDDYDGLSAATELDDKRTIEDTGRTQALVADALGIGGGVLVATGIIVYLAGAGGDAPGQAGHAGRSRRATTSVRPMLTPGGFGLAWEGSL